MPGNNCNLIEKSFEVKSLDFYTLIGFFYAKFKTNKLYLYKNITNTKE